MSQLNRRTFLAASAFAGAGLLGPNRHAGADEKVFRLGIVGSDNSHSLAFAKLCNTGQEVEGETIEGVRVTHICGADPEITRERAEGGEIANIVSGPEGMVGQVDGALCVRRHGGSHLADARPLLEAGIPVFVDKPLACSIDDAQALIALAEKAGVGFASFSTLWHARKTRDFIARVKADAGDLVAGTVTGPVQLDSEYGGVFFYGIHSVELMLATFGYGVETVEARIHKGSASVACTYADGPVVTLQLLDGAKSGFHVDAYGSKVADHFTVDHGTAYFDGLQVVLKTLKTGDWPLTKAQLLEPVKVLSAIERSLQSGAVEQVG
jgi:predicted dehydrogenase